MPPEPRYVSQPPFLHKATRSPLLTHNQALDNLDAHRMHLPPGWRAYVSYQYMEVFYYHSDTGRSVWQFPNDHFLAVNWERKLSTENVECFVETTDITQY